MKGLGLIYLACFSLLACGKNGKFLQETCEPVLIEDCYCLQVYEPVCGCDGVTYPNDCYAECSSITSYKQGECQ